jgi:DNA polymerase I-like protein with 3'-5' exonuclease and polymerase domains
VSKHRRYYLNAKNNIPIDNDYGILLTSLAHLSQEHKLLEIMKMQDKDIFTEMAADWESIPPAQVDPKQRKKAKMLCYGVLYGMGPTSLSEELGVGLESAEKFIVEFQERYPKYVHLLYMTMIS